MLISAVLVNGAIILMALLLLAFLPFWPVVGVTLFVLLTLNLYALMSIKIIPPDEVGAVILLGKVVGADSGKVERPSGPVFVPWILAQLRKFPKNPIKISLEVNSILTKEGKAKAGRKEKISVSDVQKSTMVQILCTVYVQFDRNNLLQAIENTPGPENFGPSLEPYTLGIVRALGSRLPYLLINQERFYFGQWVLARLVPRIPYHEIEILEKNGEPVIGFEEDTKKNKKDGLDGLTEDQLKDSPYVKFGLTNVVFALEDVNFEDEDLNTKINAAEKERIQVVVTKLAADASHYATIKQGEANAKARELMLKTIKDHANIEYIDALREMGKNSKSILYQMPNLEAFAGKKPSLSDIQAYLKALPLEQGARNAVMEIVSQAAGKE